VLQRGKIATRGAQEESEIEPVGWGKSKKKGANYVRMADQLSPEKQRTEEKKITSNEKKSAMGLAPT